MDRLAQSCQFFFEILRTFHKNAQIKACGVAFHRMNLPEDLIHFSLVLTVVDRALSQRGVDAGQRVFGIGQEVGQDLGLYVQDAHKHVELLLSLFVRFSQLVCQLDLASDVVDLHQELADLAVDDNAFEPELQVFDALLAARVADEDLDFVQRVRVPLRRPLLPRLLRDDGGVQRLFGHDLAHDVEEAATGQFLLGEDIVE